jgi:hypothetical protein
LLVVEDSESRLLAFVTPNLSEVVRGADRRFVKDLLDDIPERAHDDPQALFQQLSSLSVGPLITYEAGVCDDDHGRRSCPDFIPL